MDGAVKKAQVDVAEKLKIIAEWLEDKKAREAVIIDLRGMGAYADGIVIVSAGSVRHAQGLAEHVRMQAKAENYEFLHYEGFQAGQWILIDLNDVLVNIFQAQTRELYNLEGLWSDAPRLEFN
ncbi:MAG: ribosome silencing factor [Desulfovibrionaceae bacterium]|nr:ribosome silencing factor [Desulfovibrionaceae bacterium]